MGQGESVGRFNEMTSSMKSKGSKKGANIGYMGPGAPTGGAMKPPMSSQYAPKSR